MDAAEHVMEWIAVVLFGSFTLACLVALGVVACLFAREIYDSFPPDGGQSR